MSCKLLGLLATLGLVTATVPDYLEPVSYTLSFRLNLDYPDNGFQGTSKIMFKTLKNLPFNVTEIVLNSLDLTIKKAIFYYPSGKELTVKQITTNPEEETVSLYLDEAVGANRPYTLYIEYSGSLNGTEGLFVSKVNNQNYLGMKSYPVFAKRIYPCFDKPNLRAKYNIHLDVQYSRKTAPVIVTGLSSNSQAKKSLLSADLASKVDLPPYGFYFTIGSYSQYNQRFPVYTPNDNAYKTINDDLWDAVSTNILQDLIKNANQDIKLVIVPGLNVPSASGYGIAAISRDVGLSIEGNSIDAEKDQALQMFRATIHSYFSTVVSPSCWEDVWLAESIPTYIAHAAFNQLTTNWNDWPKVEVLDLQQSALANSWTTTSSPVIATNLNTSAAVVEFLSDPAIVKGSAVLGMLEMLTTNPLSSFVGFVKEKQGQSVSSEDFLIFYQQWNNLNGSIPDGKTLWNLFGPWLLDSGYPFLSVFRSDHEVLLNKKQFGEIDNTGWMLPLSYKTYYLTDDDTANLTPVTYKNQLLLGSAQNLVWLDDKVNGNYSILKDNDHKLLIVFNVNGPGPYRVLYDHSSLKLLSKQLESDVTYLENEYLRSTLISDNFAFAQKEQLTYVALFDTLRYLSSERSLSPWVIASSGLRQFWNLIYFSDLRLQFQNYVTGLMRPSYKYYGLKIQDGTSQTGKLVKQIVSSMCDYGDEVCRRETKQAYSDYIVKKKSVANKGIIDELYCNGLRDVLDSTTIRTHMARYSPSLTKYEKQSIFYYLACAGGEYGMSDAINSLLEDVLVSNSFKTMPEEDMVLAFKQIANKPQHYEEALSYLGDNFYKIRPALEEKQKAELIRYLGTLGSTDDHIAKFGNFTFSNATSSEVVQAVQDAITSVKANKQFLLNHYDDIYEGLYGFIPSTPTPVTPTAPTGPTSSPTGPTTKPPPSNSSPPSAVVIPTTLVLCTLILRYLN